MYYIVILCYIRICTAAWQMQWHLLSWQKSALRRDQNDCCACAKLVVTCLFHIIYHKIILPYQVASLRSCHVGQEAALVKLFTPAMVSSCAFHASIIITSYPVQSRTVQTEHR